MSSSLIRQVQETIARHEMLASGDVLVLGVSGGPDSLCLLDVLRRLAPDYGVALHVGHLHHGIRGEEADADARFVAERCAEWGLPCTVELADVPAWARRRGLAIEEAARQARYGFLGELARSLGGRAVAVAHNADDQVETVLMHLLRGSGLAGLRGMRPVAPLEALRLGQERPCPAPSPDSGIRLLRPLLYISRADIEAYCRERGLRPRFDRSNLDQTYYRNRLRHELLPHLESYNPNIRQVLLRTAEVLAGDHEVLRGLVEETWDAVVRQANAEAVVYDLARLRALPLGLQRSLLREGVHRLCFSLRNLSWMHVDDALRVVAEGETGAMATLPSGLMLRLGYDTAILAAQGYVAPGAGGPRVQEPVPLPWEGSVFLPGGDWVVRTELCPRAQLPADWRRNPDPWRAYLDADRLAGPLALRPRREGDWFMPLGLGHRQKVSDLLINRKVPQSERDTVPLLICGDQVAWIVGLHLDARCAVACATERVLIVRIAPTGGQDLG